MFSLPSLFNNLHKKIHLTSLRQYSREIRESPKAHKPWGLAKQAWRLRDRGRERGEQCRLVTSCCCLRALGQVLHSTAGCLTDFHEVPSDLSDPHGPTARSAEPHEFPSTLLLLFFVLQHTFSSCKGEAWACGHHAELGGEHLPQGHCLTWQVTSFLCHSVFHL